MKYVVVGKPLGSDELVFWNKDKKGWYCSDEYATKFASENEADSACCVAEETLTIDAVTNIHFKKI